MWLSGQLKTFQCKESPNFCDVCHEYKPASRLSLRRNTLAVVTHLCVQGLCTLCADVNQWSWFKFRLVPNLCAQFQTNLSALKAVFVPLHSAVTSASRWHSKPHLFRSPNLNVEAITWAAPKRFVRRHRPMHLNATRGCRHNTSTSDELPSETRRITWGATHTVTFIGAASTWRWQFEIPSGS